MHSLWQPYLQFCIADTSSVKSCTQASFCSKVCGARNPFHVFNHPLLTHPGMHIYPFTHIHLLTRIDYSCIRLSHLLSWKFLSIIDKWNEAQNRESRSSYQKRGCLMGSCLLMHGAPPLSAPLSSFPLLLLTPSTPVTFSPSHSRLHLLTLSAAVTLSL